MSWGWNVLCWFGLVRTEREACDTTAGLHHGPPAGAAALSLPLVGEEEAPRSVCCLGWGVGCLCGS